MFILKFIPMWICSIMILSGIIGYFASQLFPVLTYQKLSKIICAILVLSGIYLSGMKYVDNWWYSKAAALEQQVVELAAKSAETNTEIKTRLVTKTEIVRLRGDEITKYIDREVVKYDTQCEIPQEFTEAHNRAVEQPK